MSSPSKVFHYRICTRYAYGYTSCQYDNLMQASCSVTKQASSYMDRLYLHYIIVQMGMHVQCKELRDADPSIIRSKNLHNVYSCMRSTLIILQLATTIIIIMLIEVLYGCMLIMLLSICQLLILIRYSVGIIIIHTCILLRAKFASWLAQFISNSSKLAQLIHPVKVSQIHHIIMTMGRSPYPTPMRFKCQLFTANTANFKLIVVPEYKLRHQYIT